MEISGTYFRFSRRNVQGQHSYLQPFVSSGLARFRLKCRIEFPLAKMAPKANTGSAAAEVYEALEKLGGINEQNVKLLPKPMRTRAYAALDQWKKQIQKQQIR